GEVEINELGKSRHAENHNIAHAASLSNRRCRLRSGPAIETLPGCRLDLPGSCRQSSERRGGESANCMSSCPRLAVRSCKRQACTAFGAGREFPDKRNRSRSERGIAAGPDEKVPIALRSHGGWGSIDTGQPGAGTCDWRSTARSCDVALSG